MPPPQHSSARPSFIFETNSRITSLSTTSKNRSVPSQSQPPSPSSSPLLPSTSCIHEQGHYYHQHSKHKHNPRHQQRSRVHFARSRHKDPVLSSSTPAPQLSSSSSSSLLLSRSPKFSTSQTTTTGGCRSRPATAAQIGLLLLVFVTCVVPLSTPSSTTTTSTISSSTSTTTATPNTIISSSSSTSSGSTHLLLQQSTNSQNATTSSSSNPESSHFYTSTTAPCATAQKWIRNRGSFCFTLRKSRFVNVTELRNREARAIDMFCAVDRILDKVDCAQPYSVNVNRRQCWLCKEAYRDWACAMTTDTLENGELDCSHGVMPCPSCASICHQVMRLCPYLTPDKFQEDRYGEPTPHVSQYGGHPAFYCPLENYHASDPAFSTSDCSSASSSSSSSSSSFSSPTSDPDYIHNLCAADARYVRRSTEHIHHIHSETSSSTSTPHVSLHTPPTCCWTYSYSLVQLASAFEDSIRTHGSGQPNNRVILNCCSHGHCTTSDPDGVIAEEENLEPSPPLALSSRTEVALWIQPVNAMSIMETNYYHATPLPLRTANNQFEHDEQGRFITELTKDTTRRLNSDDDEDGDDRDREGDGGDGDDDYYYADSAPSGEFYEYRYRTKMFEFDNKREYRSADPRSSMNSASYIHNNDLNNNDEYENSNPNDNPLSHHPNSNSYTLNTPITTNTNTKVNNNKPNPTNNYYYYEKDVLLVGDDQTKLIRNNNNKHNNNNNHYRLSLHNKESERGGQSSSSSGSRTCCLGCGCGGRAGAGVVDRLLLFLVCWRTVQETLRDMLIVINTTIKNSRSTTRDSRSFVVLSVVVLVCGVLLTIITATIARQIHQNQIQQLHHSVP